MIGVLSTAVLKREFSEKFAAKEIFDQSLVIDPMINPNLIRGEGRILGCQQCQQIKNPSRAFLDMATYNSYYCWKNQHATRGAASFGTPSGPGTHGCCPCLNCHQALTRCLAKWTKGANHLASRHLLGAMSAESCHAGFFAPP